MDDLILLIIFIVIPAVLSFVGKLVKEQEERRKMREQAPRAEDLPEATRRRLYGPGPIRKAERRQSEWPVEMDTEGRNIEEDGVNTEREWAPPSPPPIRPPARPRPVRPVSVGRPPERIPGTQSMDDEFRRRKAEAERAREEADRRRREAEARQVAAEERARREQEARRRAQLSQQQQRPRPQAGGVSRPRPVEAAGAPTARREARPASERRPTRPSRLFAGPQDLRRAIVLREVLGPPKAFE